MSYGLSHIDPYRQQTALAMAAADRLRGQATRAVSPAVKVVETPLEIRDQVMAERGLNRLDIIKLSGQARLEAEISINAETNQRTRQAQIRTTGNFVDLRV